MGCRRWLCPVRSVVRSELSVHTHPTVAARQRDESPRGQTQCMCLEVHLQGVCNRQWSQGAPQDSCLFACATARHHSKQRVVGEGRDLLGMLHRPLPRDPGPGVTVTRLWMRRCRRMKEYTTCTTTAWSNQHTVVCVPFRSGCSVRFVLNYQCCCVLPELPVDTTSACSRLRLDSGMV